VETRAPRPNDLRGRPWQIGHDWRNALDQKAVIELLGKQKAVRVSVRQTDVLPHGRYLSIRFADSNAATVVLDQGFGAWVLPRHVSVRYNFDDDVGAQAKRLASVNALIQRRGIGKTYLVATAG
jgi:DEAD/DEAH box helicase domain-containing protein